MTADAVQISRGDGADELAPTDVVARFVAGFDARELPVAARATARRGYFDCLGVALAGSAQPAGQVAARFASGQGTGPATVWGHAFTAPPAIAALVNGTAAHALDYDDVNWALLGHPSVSLVPVTMAVGESAGATGAELIDAYACGFEVLAALGRSTMPGLSFDGGWHATGALGAIGLSLPGVKVRGTQRNMADWARLDRCRTVPRRARIGSQVIRQQWHGCARGTSAVLYTIVGGGHSWPGADPAQSVGLTTQQVDASSQVLSFFDRIRD